MARYALGIGPQTLREAVMAGNRESAQRKWKRSSHSAAAVSSASAQRLFGRVGFSLLAIALIVAVLWAIFHRTDKPHTHFVALRITETGLLAVPPLPFVHEDLEWLGQDFVLDAVQSSADLEKWSHRPFSEVALKKIDVAMIYIIAHGVTVNGEPYLVASDFGSTPTDSTKGLFPVRSLLESLAKNLVCDTVVVFDCSRTPPDEYSGWTISEFTSGLKTVLADIDAERLWVLSSSDHHPGLNVYQERHSLFGLAWQEALQSAPQSDGELAVSLTDLALPVQQICLQQSQGRQSPVLLDGHGEVQPDSLAKSPILRFPTLPKPPAESESKAGASDSKQARRPGRHRPVVAAAGMPRLVGPAAFAQAEATPKKPDKAAPAENNEGTAPKSAPEKNQPAAAALPSENKPSGQAVLQSDGATDTESLLGKVWQLRDQLESFDPDPRTSPLLYAPHHWREVNESLRALESQSLGGAHYRSGSAGHDVVADLKIWEKDFSALSAARKEWSPVAPPENFGLYRQLIDAWNGYRVGAQAVKWPDAFRQPAWNYAVALNRIPDLNGLAQRTFGVRELRFRAETADVFNVFQAIQSACEQPLPLNSSPLVKLDGTVREWLKNSDAEFQALATKICEQTPKECTLSEGYALETLLTSPHWRSETRATIRKRLQGISTQPRKQIPKPESQPLSISSQASTFFEELRKFAGAGDGEFSKGVLQRLDARGKLSSIEVHRLASLLDARDADRYPHVASLELTFQTEKKPSQLTLALNEQEVDLDQGRQAEVTCQVQWTGDPETKPPASVQILSEFDSRWVRLVGEKQGSSTSDTPWTVPLKDGRGEFKLLFAGVPGALRKTAEDPVDRTVRIVARIENTLDASSTVKVKLPVFRKLKLAVETPFQGRTYSEELSQSPGHASLILDVHANRVSPTHWTLDNPSLATQSADVWLIEVYRSDDPTWVWPQGRLFTSGSPIPELRNWLLDSSGQLTQTALRRVFAKASGIQLEAGASKVPITWGSEPKSPDNKPAETKAGMTPDPRDVSHGLVCAVRDGNQAWSFHWIEVQPVRPYRFLEARGAVTQETEKVKATFDVSLKESNPHPQLLPVDIDPEHPFYIEWQVWRSLPTGTENQSGGSLNMGKRPVQLYARIQGERNQAEPVPVFITVDGWPRAFRFNLPLAPFTDPRPGDERKLEPLQGREPRRVEIREVQDVLGAKNEPTRVYRPAAQPPSKLPEDAGAPRPEILPLPSRDQRMRRLMFATREDQPAGLLLNVRFEVDAPAADYENERCSAVVLELDGNRVETHFSDRSRKIWCVQPGDSTSGTLQFDVSVDDFQARLPCGRGTNREAKLAVKLVRPALMPGSSELVLDSDEIPILFDGSKPEIGELAMTPNRDTLQLRAVVTVRDGTGSANASGIDAVHMALSSTKERKEIPPEAFVSARLLQGDTYECLLPTAQIEGKDRQAPYKLFVVAKDRVGHQSEGKFEARLPEPKPAPPKEPDKPQPEGVIRGKLVYPSGVPAGGVEVRLQGGGKDTTKGDGLFEIRMLKVGQPYKASAATSIAGKSYELPVTALVTAKSAPSPGEKPDEPEVLELQEKEKRPGPAKKR
jgi:hypothetical protein